MTDSSCLYPGRGSQDLLPRVLRRDLGPHPSRRDSSMARTVRAADRCSEETDEEQHREISADENAWKRIGGHRMMPLRDKAPQASRMAASKARRYGGCELWG